MDTKKHPLTRCFEGWSQGIAQSLNDPQASVRKQKYDHELERQIKAEEKRKRRAAKRMAK